MAEILNDLHGLHGSTLGEIFHSLNLFLKNHEEEIKINLDYIFSNFKADNQLKQLIRIRLIDQHQCYDEMMKVLKSDDTFYVSHVLQCSWFFKDSSSFDPDVFVNSVLPCLSFSTRSKVLKKYSKLLRNSKIGNSLFTLLKQRYGLNTAVLILPACSESFLKQFFQSPPCFLLPLYVIIPLFRIHPLIVFNYVSYLLDSLSKGKRVLKKIDLSSYEKVFLLIASKYPEKFSTLREKYHQSFPYLKLGKRSTRRLLRNSYDSVRNRIHAFSQCMMWKNVANILNIDQLSALQLSLFPGSPSEFIQLFSPYSDFCAITHSLKSHVAKKNILVANFQKAYGKPIINFLDSLNYEIASSLPLELAEKWVELKLPTTDDPYLRGNYIVYLPADRALTQMKKIMENTSDVGVRFHLAKCLIKVAVINNDPKLIGPMCEYIVKRFRNDRAKETFVSELATCVKIMQVPEEAWPFIEELVNIMMLTEDSCTFDLNTILSKQIQDRFERGLPVDSYLKKLMKLTKNFYKFDLCMNTKFEKLCLEWFLDWFPEKKVDSPEKSGDNLDSLFSQICLWNAKHPNDKIQVPEWMTEQILNVFSSEDCYHYRKSNILDKLRKDKQLTREFYEKIFPKYLDPQILTYKLRHNPAIIKDNLSYLLPKFLNQSLGSFLPFFSRLRLYTLFSLPEMICEYCLKILNEKRSDENGFNVFYTKRNAIKILSMLLPSDKYVTLISDYYPLESTHSDYSDEGRDLFEIQSEIAKSFKSVSTPSTFIASVKKFAIGDYLKLTVSSLNSVFLRVPEEKALPLLEGWLDSPVSVRKHVIRSYFKIAPVGSIKEMLLGLYAKEKNVSIRFVLVEHSLRFFLGEPSIETFSVLKAVANQLLSTDEEAFEKLLEIDRVPDEFLSEYLGLLWDKANLKTEAIKTKKRNQIINLIDKEVICLLTDEFCDSLISQVFDQSEIFPCEMRDFVVHYLLWSRDSEEQRRRLEKVINGMKRLLADWNQYNLKASHVFPSRKALFLFIDSLVHEVLQHRTSVLTDFITKFKEAILIHLKKEDILEEIVLLEMLEILLSTNAFENANYFSNSIVPIIDQVIPVYGFESVGVIATAIKKLLFVTESESNKKLLDLSENLIQKNVNYYQLIGLILIPTNVHKDVEQFERILNLVLSITDPTVKVLANKLFKDLSSSVTVY